jgi:hypothetical protein
VFCEQKSCELNVAEAPNNFLPVYKAGRDRYNMLGKIGRIDVAIVGIKFYAHEE